MRPSPTKDLLKCALAFRNSYPHRPMLGKGIFPYFPDSSGGQNINRQHYFYVLVCCPQAKIWINWAYLFRISAFLNSYSHVARIEPNVGSNKCRENNINKRHFCVFSIIFVFPCLFIKLQNLKHSIFLYSTFYCLLL